MNAPAYPPALAPLLDPPRVMPLGPGTPAAGVADRVRALALPPAALAGLWLYFDHLDASHAVSQDLHTPDGSVWHAVVHRREPDAFNSKYWWRQAGRHPLYDALRQHAPAVGYVYTTPEAFVDYCETHRDTDTDHERVAERVQLVEWQLMFAHCMTGVSVPG